MKETDAKLVFRIEDGRHYPYEGWGRMAGAWLQWSLDALLLLAIAGPRCPLSTASWMTWCLMTFLPWLLDQKTRKISAPRIAVF